MNLFGETAVDTVMRAMCWYQPFGSLMLHGKIETREWNKELHVRGKFLIYTSKKPFIGTQEWLVKYNVNEVLKDEPTKYLNGYAIAVADLVGYRKMLTEDEKKCFVDFSSIRKCLIFENVRRIEPFEWNFGQQGIAFVPESEKLKIKYI